MLLPDTALTVTVTIEMTQEEAEALAFVTSDGHPGRRSLEDKLRRFALRHPAIVNYHRAQAEEAKANHEAMLSRTASSGLFYASCACGWNSRDYRDFAKAEAALDAHRAKAQR